MKLSGWAGNSSRSGALDDVCARPVVALRFESGGWLQAGRGRSRCSGSALWLSLGYLAGSFVVRSREETDRSG